MEFGIGSIGLAALLTSLGATPDEIDGAVEILSNEYPNPQDYASIVRQASGALGRFRSRNTDASIVDAIDDPVPTPE